MKESIYARLQSDGGDVILEENALNTVYDLKKHFESIAGQLTVGGSYMLVERITDDMDGYVNTLISSLEPEHVRAPRAAEVIGAAGEYLELAEFLRSAQIYTYSIPIGNERKSVERQLNSMPEDIKSRLKLKIDGDEISFEVYTAVFVWGNSRCGC